MQDYDEDRVPHTIRCTSKWGTCNGAHATAGEVKDCWRKVRTPGAFPCSWLIELRYDDGSIYHAECGALSLETAHGYSCEAGHSHMDMQYMAERGMAYAEDSEEARRLISVGVQPLDMQGRVWA